MYKFSISWTRILPDGKLPVNQNGINFYIKLIDELIENNIEPVVTLFHVK
jgi:beta-glucosidase/6-phospho-beta-glucosidase/beta-galactosidase